MTTPYTNNTSPLPFYSTVCSDCGDEPCGPSGRCPDCDTIVMEATTVPLPTPGQLIPFPAQPAAPAPVHAPTSIVTLPSAWYERLTDQVITLDEAIVLTTLLARDSREDTFSLGQFRFLFDDGNIVLEKSDRGRLQGNDLRSNHGHQARYILNHWSFGQLCTLLGAPGAYLRSLPGDLAVECLNHSLIRRNKDVAIFRTAIEVGGIPADTIRAVTSPRYTRYSDCKLLEWAKNSGYPTGRVSFSDRGVSVTLQGKNIFAPDTGTLKVNMVVENSEVGAASISATAVIERPYLRIPITLAGIRIRHTGTEIEKRALDSLNRSKSRFEEVDTSDLEAALNKAADLETRTRGEWYSWLKAKGVGKSLADKALPKGDDEITTSRWRMAVALAYQAHGVPYFDSRMQAEKLAAKVLGV